MTPTTSCRTSNDPATEYAHRVLDGRIPACKWQKLACQRHLNDLERQSRPDFPFKYVPAKGEKVVKFTEALPHVKGKWAAKGELIKEELWQKFIDYSLFGWVEKAAPYNYRFREAYIKVSRKNAKSTKAACIGLFKFAADKEHGAEVYSGATSEKQAWEVFRPALQMAERTPALRKAFGITVGARAMAILKTGSRFEPVIGKPGDGPSPSCAIVDEYHEHPDDTLYDTQKTGMGARENPLLLVITTAGSDRSSPCYQLELDAQKVLEGKIKNERWFVLIFQIDTEPYWEVARSFQDVEKWEKACTCTRVMHAKNADGDLRKSVVQALKSHEAKCELHKRHRLEKGVFSLLFPPDDWTSREALAKANPNLDVSVKLDYLCEMQDAAIRSPRKQNTFKTKHLGVWVNADVSWMNMARWDELADPTLKIEDFKKEECVDAFDLATRIDIASKVRVFQRPGDKPDKPHLYVFGAHYINQARVDETENQHYAGWANEDRLIVTPGNTTDFNWIADGLIEDTKLFNVRELPHDPWHAAALIAFIQARPDWDQTKQFVEIRQTVQNLSPAMKELEALVVEGRLHHDGDPVLGWMISNVVCHVDAKDNIFPRKQNDKNKIDGAIALIMAVGAWMRLGAVRPLGRPKISVL